MQHKIDDMRIASKACGSLPTACDAGCIEGCVEAERFGGQNLSRLLAGTYL